MAPVPESVPGYVGDESAGLGIDLSEKMIARAREINGDERITYRICGLEEYEYPEEEYDCVVSNLALHYIEDLDTVYQKICRTLKPGGIFLLNIEHPAFTAGVNEDWIYDKDGKKILSSDTVSKAYILTLNLQEEYVGILNKALKIGEVSLIVPEDTYEDQVTSFNAESEFKALFERSQS